MKLLKQNRQEPNCLVFAAAMTMDVDPEEIFKFAGHRGQDIWWPDQIGDSRLRGFHIQEIIEYGLNIGYALTPIEADPCSAPVGCDLLVRNIHRLIEAEANFNSWIDNFNAILITKHHALAWDYNSRRCYDPNGMIQKISDYEVHEAWLVIEIKSP